MSDSIDNIIQLFFLVPFFSMAVLSVCFTVFAIYWMIKSVKEDGKDE